MPKSSALKAESLESIIQIRGRFVTWPGEHVTDDFKAWLLEDGRPDAWKDHDKSKPPKSEDFEEIFSFVIPESKRSGVGLATCPICSPTKGKYYEGVLAWFPAEGVLRAIGHECAKTHFGAEIANAARAKRHRRTAVERAQEFLMTMLPKVALLQADAAMLVDVARDVDLTRQAFWNRSSKNACERLVKLGQRNELALYEEREISAINAYGKETARTESRVIKTFEVNGLSFLKEQFSTMGLALATNNALSQIRAATPDEALEFVAEDLRKDEHLFEAERLTRAAVEQLDNLRAAIHQAKTFLAEENLARLSEWSCDFRSGAPLIVYFNHSFPERVRIHAPGRKGRDVPISARLRD